MKPTRLPQVIGHTCALAAGAALAWWSFSHRGQAAAEGSGIEAASSSSTGIAPLENPGGKTTSEAHGRGITSTTAERSRAYREAWQALLWKEVSPGEREALQRKLLAEWVEVDPQAAIQAALDELGMTRNYTGEGLLAAFNKKIREQPTLFWPMIQERRFGMATAYFKSQWMSVVGKSDPDLLFSYFDEFSAAEKSRAMVSALEGLEGNPQRIESLAKQLAAQPDTPENRKLRQTLGGHLAEHRKLADLAKSFSEAKTPGEEEIYLAGVVSYTSRRHAKFGELREHLDAMPEEAAKKAELAIVRETMYSDAIADIASRMIEREDWETLKKEIPKRMHVSVGSRDMETFLHWAQDLPERTETEDLYRCTIRGHINSNPAKARDWIEEMPAGWKRDNALVEYVNSSLNTRKDPAAAAWAMERIESDHFLGAAEEMKSGWEASNKK